MLRPEDLRPGSFYTIIGNNMMAVTVAQDIQFVKISSGGSIVFKKREKDGFSKNVYSLPLGCDYEFLPDTQARNRIYSDSQIATHGGNIMFSGDNMLNVVSDRSAEDLRQFFEANLSQDYRIRVVLYELNPKTNTRAEEGLPLFDTDLIFS
jgi:hypothetical protein